jgi:hypothetical protein
MSSATGILFSLRHGSRGGSETHSLHQLVEIINDALIKPVEQGLPLSLQLAVAGNGAKQSGGERSIDALEELEEDERHRVTAGQDAIPAGMRHFLDESLCSELRQIVAQRPQTVAGRGTAERIEDFRVEFGSRECRAAGNMGKANQRVHQRQLARVVEFQTGYAFAARQDGRFSEFAQLTAVDERLQDILLDVLVIVVDSRELLPQLRKVSTALFTP